MELLRHTEAVLALPSIAVIERYPFALMAGASAAVGRGDTARGDTARAEHLCARALEATSEPNDELEGRAALVRFQAALVTGDRHGLIEHLERALHHFRRLGSPYRLVHVLNVLAAIRTHGGDSAAATDAAREALVFARQTGNPGLTSGSLAGLAFVLADSEPERSRELIAESLELNHHLAATVVDELALVLTIVASAMLGERNQVMRLSARAFDCGLTGITPLSSCLECAAEALAAGEPAVAAVVHGYLDAWAPHLTERQPHLTFRQRATAVIDAQLDVKHVIELHAQGAAMTLNQATAHALEAIERVMPDATH